MFFKWTALQWCNRLIVMTLCVSAISIVTEYIVEVLLIGSTNVLLVDFLNLFTVNLEETIPTWYATTLLFVAAVLLVIIASIKWRDKDIDRWYWSILALGFFYLSMDEGAQIHEIFVDPTQQAFNPSGFFAFGWQIVAIPVVIVVGLLFARFIIRLPSRTRIGVIISGGVYLGGALIIEGISASLWDINDAVSLVYLAVATVEETFEMLGVVFFIYTLLDHMEGNGYSLVLTQDSQTNAPRKPHNRRPVSLVIPVLVVLNVMLLMWLATATQPVLTEAKIPETINIGFHNLIEEEVLADGGVIVETQGIFGIDNPFSRTLGATLLEQYSNVFAVSLPNENSTTLVATNTLGLSRDDIVDLLHQIGETNFIIFDTPTVQAISQVLQ